MNPCARGETMEMYRNIIGKQSSFVISTDSDFFKFLKSSDAEAMFEE
jgi:hypothetical protein